MSRSGVLREKAGELLSLFSAMLSLLFVCPSLVFLQVFTGFFHKAAR
jgi:hypothetical protein